jgi:hypothetical protein
MSEVTSRNLLTSLGIGDFSATMIIPYMMIAPATTDPKSAQIILLVRQLQRELYRMGATSVPNSGHLDPPTASALRQIVGPDWERMSWADNIVAVLAARDQGRRLSSGVPDDSAPMATSGLGFLPDVPGGLLTYAIAGIVAYHFWKKTKP